MEQNDPVRPYADYLQILRRPTDLIYEGQQRDEIFSAERMEQYATYLAGQLRVSTLAKKGKSLTPLLKKNGRDLLVAYRAVADVMKNKESFSPAAEWFVDNFHIVEDQLREIKQDLPNNYYYELPKLLSGELKNYPRVYAIALAIIAHTDSRLDAETLRRFVVSFQKEVPLTIGELWALPITLRIALIEHLRPLAQRIVTAREKRRLADECADKLLELASKSQTTPGDMIAVIGSELNRQNVIDRAFVVQVIQRLRDQDPKVSPALDYLEEKLAEHETTTHEVIQLEHKRQAAAQVTVGNIITSMRLLSSMDWRDFFESVSLVDSILAHDPAAVYSRMDFATRDSYRHAIERLSRRSKLGELEIADKVRGQCMAQKDPIRRHVGYYLIGEGKYEFEELCKFSPTAYDTFARWVKTRPTLVYLGSCALLSAFLSFTVVRYFDILQFVAPLAVLFLLLTIFISIEFSLSLLNHYVTYFVKPRKLPKIETERGIPEDAKTLVVVPTLFISAAVVTELVESLQVHFLANKDKNIFFALLGDFADADTEVLPQDAQLLKVAVQGIAELNARYSHPDPRKKYFHLFVRKRQFNPSEGKWIGWERKRGKLHELNKLILEGGETSYIHKSADHDFLKAIRYVITLDSDTQIPRDVARTLVGTICHPLNQPIYDEELGRVTQGYGILQPRVSISHVSSSRTHFSKIFSGNTGLDPYTTAVSDVYQDLFSEGIYTGKGLYDVAIYEQALKDRIPENTLLSHDLFESSYARAALVTDLEFFDDYPSDFDSYSKRQHRWTRGDWQIAQWLFPKIPHATLGRDENTISLISRWRIFDNLRRSLTPAVLLFWLVFTWLVPFISSVIGTIVFVFVVVFPAYAPLTNSVLFRRRGVPWKGHFRNIGHEAYIKLGQVFLTIAFLPNLAFVQCDAIARVLYRKNISKKKLLEWVSFAQVEGDKGSGRLLSLVGFAPIFALLTFVALLNLRSDALYYATPFLLVWLASPLIKRWSSETIRTETTPLTFEELKQFRRYARKTWHFFETFVGPGDNWLAPDNFQEDPVPVVAHRTSPTNIGLQLLATVSAHDLGYIGHLEFLERIEKTFATLEKLSKLNGHFFNWYDTQTLEAMRPQYISTVDSGNLAGHFLALKQACVEYNRRPFLVSQATYGLIDSLESLRDILVGLDNIAHSLTFVTFHDVRAHVENCLAYLNRARAETVDDWNQLLEYLTTEMQKASEIMVVINADVGADKIPELNRWFTICSRQIASFHKDLAAFAPWANKETEDLHRDLRLFHKSVPSLSQIMRTAKNVNSEGVFTKSEYTEKVTAGALAAEAAIKRSRCIQEACDQFVNNMDFRFLFDEQRKIFVIGYNVADARKDNSYYDLLASESRLASFIAIAKGDIPQEHWFRLGRQLTSVHGSRALISWTATMFEYLMPLLVMRRYSNTLLDQTYEAVLQRQVEYGKHNHVPWGVSEAGYNARDLQLNFQYGPFGVPGLGLKRGLSDDLVVSPYSSMLASMVDPHQALSNLQRLEQNGVLSQYGFFESIDYTPERLPQGESNFVLRSFMAHHQGMSLVSLSNVIHRNIMQRRFHQEPIIRATQLLLQERIPQEVQITKPRAEEVRASPNSTFTSNPNPRIYTDIQLPTPRTQLLSNGTYSLMVTSAGAGYSRCGSVALSRWREDVTRDNWGQFFYIRNRRTGRVWSGGMQPAMSPADRYEVTFAEDKVDFWREDELIATHTELIVSQEDNVELRRLSLTNNSAETCEIEVTSFMEVVLARPADDAAHPSFSNLFVQTEFAKNESALLATRRQRSHKEMPIWGFHAVVCDGTTVGSLQYETDRSRFIGRGHTTASPVVIKENRPLSGTVGAVLDPIFALRQTLVLAPGQTMRLLFATGVTDSKQEALRLADKYHDKFIFAREAGLAWTKSQVQLRHLNIESDQAHNYQRLAGRLIFSDYSLRPRSGVLAQNSKTQSALWAYGISGDLPIILVRIDDEKDIDMVREVLHAHEYLRFRGLSIDLVILNEKPNSYIQSLQDELQRQVQMSGAHSLMDRPGGVFLRRADHIPADDLILLKTVARVSLSAEKGTFLEQITRRPHEVELPAKFLPTKLPPPRAEFIPPIPDLKFFNGLGGFSAGGRFYTIVLKENQWTPAPWINVIANSHEFGFTVSECGAGYTWSQNSRENRLTPWSNDAVSDTPGEIVYIRDEETGEVWTPTPLPVREKELYVIKHTQGYSQFDHSSHGIHQELQLYVALEANVKIVRLRLKNLGTEKRSLSVTGYVDWVLGFQKSFSAPFAITEVDKATGTIYARNPYNNEFAHRVAFFDMSETKRTFTCDRREFIGRNGNLVRPAALDRVDLSGNFGAGLDPCSAMQAKFELAAKEEREIIFVLGQADTIDQAREIAQQFRNPARARTCFKEVVQFWDETLSSIQVKTPDESLDALVNRWLLYQTLSCRIWARSAFYQSGGAYGFRDQLQDVLALLYSKPEIAKSQIIRSAQRQFKEGDVQHWWHPPTGRGVRTRCSDDLLWLPFVTSLYVKVTGDESILATEIPFIDAPELNPGQDDAYIQPAHSDLKSSLFDHCLRAIERSLKVGEHGLPLIGNCDWNDGMSRVGHEGKGESVWVAWFLHSTLEAFIPYCEKLGESECVDRYRQHQRDLVAAIENNAWDGDWYRRAYFDNGAPLGSAMNEECKIDSLAQSWAVISAAGDKERAKKAMNAVDEYLVNRGDGLIKLFTPPFDKGTLDPGYIKGYLPGVRENGGQYTHAAIWTLMAYAKLGDGDRAVELFDLINPINHASTHAGLYKYKVEPYVIAADIYGMNPHTGRGGWTWYTGSASWMYRAAIESILGLQVEGDKLRLRPCVPKLWRDFSLTYNYQGTEYALQVSATQNANCGEVTEIEVDGERVSDFVPLVKDGKKHVVKIKL